MKGAWAELCRRAAISAQAAQGGNVAVLFAVVLPMFVGGVGLGVETSYWRYMQLEVQGAADAAAYAAAVESGRDRATSP